MAMAMAMMSMTDGPTGSFLFNIVVLPVDRKW